MTKPANAAKALGVVIAALDPLEPADRQWVLQSAASKWTLAVPPAPGTPLPLATANLLSGGGAADAQAAITAKSVRAFLKAKKPGNDVERVACLGYFIMKTTGQPGFNRKEINKAHTDSGGSNFNITRALDNSTRGAKYLSAAGKGQKQVTTLGEEVVEALPSREAVTAVLAQSSGRKRVSRSKKAKKKTG